MHILFEVLTLLLLSIAAVAVLQRLKLPAIIGYVLVGAVAGPHALGWLSESETIRFLGDVGVAFLLFTLGLEFSIAQFLSMRRVLLILGGAQVLLGTLSGALIAWMFGLPPAAAFVVGGALSMSSTAIVVRQLRDELELQTPHGRLAVGILLFQDLAAVPFLVVIPLVAQAGGVALGIPLALAFAKALAVAAVLLAGGRYLLRPLLYEAGGSGELFTLAVLLLTLGAAWVTELSGLSLAFGAFLAGLMLAETEYRHQVENEIRPFRDVLLGLFFIVVGMQLRPALLRQAWFWTALLLSGVVIGKGALITVLARGYGYRLPEALRTGIVLAQGGEFGVALVALAISTGLFSGEASQPVLAAIVVSMVIAPVLIRKSGALAERLSVAAGNDEPGAPETALAEAMTGVRDHVLVCGYGRVGRQLTAILAEQGIESIALDIDTLRVKRAWEAGEQVYYGDASQRGVLLAAGVAYARALVVSFDHLPATFKAVHEARAVNATLPILVRAEDDTALEPLLEAGATEVVPETLEASLMLATQLLLLLGTPGERVLARMRSMRSERYRLLRPYAAPHERNPEPAGRARKGRATHD